MEEMNEDPKETNADWASFLHSMFDVQRSSSSRQVGYKPSAIRLRIGLSLTLS
jgi:hypothetical protein